MERNTPDAAPETDELVLSPAQLERCVVSHGCGMSHPGLGNFGTSVSVDLAVGTIQRRSWDDRGAGRQPKRPSLDDLPEVATPRGRGRPATRDAAVADAATDAGVPERMSDERLRELRARLSRIRRSDIAKETEIPRMDTTSCSLTVECPEDDGSATLTVQRQTRGGPGPIAQVIQFLP